MGVMELAICMERGDCCAALTGILRDWAFRCSADVTIKEYHSAEAFFQAYEPGRYCFVFLDTGFVDLPGLEAARRMRAAGDNCQIVFFSDDAHNALACYEAHPAGFYLKPPDSARLIELLQWHRALFLPAMRSITVVSSRVPRKLLLAQIRYIEVSGRTSLVHLEKETIATNRTLNELAEELSTAQFCRCHRSYLVNLAHITDMKGRTLLLDDGYTLPVSGDRAVRTREWLQQHIRRS